jgi:hypothetical protein
MLISASANTRDKSANTPTKEKSKGPATSKALQPPSERTPCGTNDSSHTIDNSSVDRITADNSPPRIHSGTLDPAGSCETAKLL